MRLSRAKLAGAKVTLLVGGKAQGKPRIRLEIETVGGNAVLRPLPDEFLNEETGFVRLVELAEWLHLEQPSAVEAVKAIYPDHAQWLDTAGLASQLGVATDAPVSELMILVRREQERWVVKSHRDLPGTPRVPLGTVTLAKEEAALGAVPPAAPISVDGPAPAPGAAVEQASSAGESSRRGCLWWVMGLLALSALGLVGFLLLRPDGSDGADPTAGAATATPEGPAPGEVGDGPLPVAAYADAACTIFGGELPEANTRFRGALDAASGATEDLPAVYSELAAASAAFADALDEASKDLEDLPPPDVVGGEEAHQATVTGYADAATAVRAIGEAAAGFDPTTADQAEADALGDSINKGLADFSAALAGDPSTAQIDAAFQNSEVCAQL